MAKIKILSIDGGGIRGIIPGTILNYIETKIQEYPGQEDSKLADHFDLIAGTSTGGILTCTYLIPDNNGKSKYSTEFALDIYLKTGQDIFSRTSWQKLKTLGGITGPKYSASNIDKELDTYFDDHWISDLRRPCIITSYDIVNRKTVFFNKLDGVDNNVRNYRVRDVARATSAAPTYFPPAHISSENGTISSLVDGGVFANNPALCAYSEARTLDFGKLNTPGNTTFPSAKDMMILSLGTGTVKESYPYDKAKNWGAVGWIKPVIDVMMSGNSETVDYQLKQIFDATSNGQYYHRIQPGLKEAKAQMDDVSDQNLKALHQAGLQYIAENQEQLDNIVKQILDTEDTTT